MLPVDLSKTQASIKGEFPSLLRAFTLAPCRCNGGWGGVRMFFWTCCAGYVIYYVFGCVQVAAVSFQTATIPGSWNYMSNDVRPFNTYSIPYNYGFIMVYPNMACVHQNAYLNGKIMINAPIVGYVTLFSDKPYILWSSILEGWPQVLTLSLAFCKARSKLAMLTEYWQASPRTWLELSQGVNSSPLNPIELLGEPICYPSEKVCRFLPTTRLP